MVKIVKLADNGKFYQRGFGGLNRGCAHFAGSGFFCNFAVYISAYCAAC